MHEVLSSAKLDKLASVEKAPTEVKPGTMGGSVQTEGVEQILQAIERCDREIANCMTTYGDWGVLLGIGDWWLERDLLVKELERRGRTARS